MSQSSDFSNHLPVSLPAPAFIIRAVTNNVTLTWLLRWWQHMPFGYGHFCNVASSWPDYLILR
jgi:hypothetical protein